MKDKIRILILDNSFTFGGAINSLRHLCNSLDKTQFAPILISGQSENFLNANFSDILHYHFVPKLSWINNSKYNKIKQLSLSKKAFMAKTLNIFRFIYWQFACTIPETVMYYRIAKKHKVDIIHLNNIFGSQAAGIFASKLLRIPCLAHLRMFEEVHPITKLYASLVDHHIAISNATLKNLSCLGVPSKKITLVHDAIDLTDFDVVGEQSAVLPIQNLNSSQLKYGIFGRVVEWKGVREFIIASKTIINEVPDACAFIVGGTSDGDEAFYQEMQKLAVDLGLREKIIFTGYRSDISAVMEKMNVIVHASTVPEPFGMVIIEGMAMQKPVVATAAGGPLDIIINGKTGILVEINNSEALGKAVVSLLKQPDIRNRMGLEGRKRVENYFNNHRYARQIESIYQRITR